MEDNLLLLLNKTIGYFKSRNIENARLKTEKIFSEILNISRIELYTNFERILNKDEKDFIRDKIKNIDEEESMVLRNDDSIKTILTKSIKYLKKYNCNEPVLNAELIISKVINTDRMMLFLKYNNILNEQDKEKVRYYLKKIAIDKFPLQYLFNEQEFYGRKFFIEKGVLIPRFDTETLVEQAILLSKEGDKILDIGTGSGIIAISLALEIKKSKVIGIDISEKAIEIANRNIMIHGVDNVRILKSNLFENIEYNKFDMIISNPPYISVDEIGYMSEDILIHEPHDALFAENNGLYFYYEIAKESINYLKDDGYIIVEIGFKQAEAVSKIFTEIGFKNIKVIKDINNNDRVVYGQK